MTTTIKFYFCYLPIRLNVISTTIEVRDFRFLVVCQFPSSTFVWVRASRGLTGYCCVWVTAATHRSAGNLAVL